MISIVVPHSSHDQPPFGVAFLPHVNVTYINYSLGSGRATRGRLRVAAGSLPGDDLDARMVPAIPNSNAR